MERDYYNEDFERFLRRNANNLRMTAPDRIWSKISKELSRRRRRINYALTAFLIISVTAGYYLISTSEKLQTANTITQPVKEKSVTVNVPTQPQIITAPIAEVETTSSTKKSSEIRETFTQKAAVATRKNVTEPTPVYTSELVHPIVFPETVAALKPAEIKQDVPVETTANATEKTEDVLTTEKEETETESAPFTTESVTNIFKSASKKLSWQLSFTPTISYRKLGENKSYLRNSSQLSAPANMAALYNVNNAVTHKPDLGFEVGVSSKYNVSEKAKLLAGVQFNVNRYDIKAFSAPYAMATIQLNSPTGTSSLNMVTGYSNTTGYKSNWLQNFYFQISAPVGMELKLAGDDKTQFGLSGTLQPTYLIGDRAYLITADYKNYAQVPWLVRRWNANTSMQTFVSYYTGKVKWQVGPQVRYQLLSSFISKYPVKENLFDFGMRVGVNLSKD